MLKKLKDFWRRLKARIHYLIHKNDYKDTHNEQVKLAWFLHLAQQNREPGDGPYIQHPGHGDTVKRAREEIKDLATRIKKNEIMRPRIRIAIGDSLMEFPRDDFESIDLNLGLAGSWAHQMLQILEDTYPSIKRELLKWTEVEAIIIGCNGNQILTYNTITASTNRMMELLNETRKKFPGQRFVVYGLPPVYNIYANLVADEYEQNLIDWVKADGNAVFLALRDSFAGPFGIFPTVEMSTDGIHMTAPAVIKFDEQIEEALLASPGTVIY